MSQEPETEPVGEPVPDPDAELAKDTAASDGDSTPEEIPAGATWEEAPGLIGRGLAMGMADVVPGVSGGTMALILGIYTRLIAAIRSLDLDALRLLFGGKLGEVRDRVHWRFLGAVVCGQLIGVAICTRVIKLPELIKTHPEPVYALFFGLVLGSTIWLLRDLAREAEDRAKLALPLLGGLLSGLAVVTAVPTEGTESSAAFLFFCGSISICAMVLPGISGSFVLLLLKQYEHVLGAVGEVIDPTTEAGRLGPLVETIVPFAAGCLVGLLTFVRVLSVLLRRAEHATMAFMGGLLTGSLYALWPFAIPNYKPLLGGETKLVGRTPQLPDISLSSTWLAIGLLVLGAGSVIALERIAPGKSKGGS
jgi:putative membrane protein